MSLIARFESRLHNINLEVMKKAIEATQKELGGKGLLSVKTVRGYYKSTRADLVFQFDEMRFPMGIKQSKKGKVEFVGDPWGSKIWKRAQELIERNYIALCGAIAMQRMNFVPSSETQKDPVAGVMVEGMRT